MKAKRNSSFLILFLGMVVLTVFSSFSLAAQAAQSTNSVPTRVPSKETREVRVFLKTQCFGFYEKGSLVFWGPICSGRKGLETPKGKFRVLFKAKNYRSRKYDGAAMPYAVQFSHCGCFLHVGDIRPQPASHGCVRLKERDAERIFRAVKIKDPVIITD